MKNQPLFSRLLTFSAILLSVFAVSSVSAGNSPYGNNPNPIRVYYFGYNVTGAGFGIGTEINLSWTKMEKTGCKGARVSDRQFRMIPNLGMFTNESGTQSLFGNLEFNYGLTYRHGLTVEFFGAGGYAQMLSELAGSTNDNQKTAGSDVTAEATSGFMPQAGIGFGYDFQKINGKDFPLELNLRGLATSTNISESVITPAFQAGLIYSF